MIIPRSWLLVFGVVVPSLLRADPLIIEAKLSQPAVWIAPDAKPAAAPKSLLASWNIRWFPGGSPTKSTPKTVKEQTEGIRQVLASQLPGVAFLCEVRDIDALKSLDLPYSYIACTQIPRTEAEDTSLPNQGLAVMSQIPWKEIWVVDFSGLPETPDKPSRGLLGVTFENSDGIAWTLYGVHLKSNRGGPEATMMRRARAIDYLENDWKRKGLDPQKDIILVAGDYNSSPNDPAFAAEKTFTRLKDLGFVEAAQGLPQKERMTISEGDRFPPNDFDHIFLSPAAQKAMGTPPPWLKIIKVGEKVSDHYALFMQAPWLK